jgi:hypothetical protein
LDKVESIPRILSNGILLRIVIAFAGVFQVPHPVTETLQPEQVIE